MKRVLYMGIPPIHLMVTFCLGFFFMLILFHVPLGQVPFPTASENTAPIVAR